jgi:hypothetical protein
VISLQRALSGIVKQQSKVEQLGLIEFV